MPVAGTDGVAVVVVVVDRRENTVRMNSVAVVVRRRLMHTPAAHQAVQGLLCLLLLLWRWV